MAHPYHHALSSMKKWGGAVEDYLAIHCLVRRIEKNYRRFPSPGAQASCRGDLHERDHLRLHDSAVDGSDHSDKMVGEQHVREDLGFIPSFADWVKAIRPEPWMGRTAKLESEHLQVPTATATVLSSLESDRCPLRGIR